MKIGYIEIKDKNRITGAKFAIETAFRQLKHKGILRENNEKILTVHWSFCDIELEKIDEHYSIMLCVKSERTDPSKGFPEILLWVYQDGKYYRDFELYMIVKDIDKFMEEILNKAADKLCYVLRGLDSDYIDKKKILYYIGYWDSKKQEIIIERKINKRNSS